MKRVRPMKVFNFSTIIFCTVSALILTSCADRGFNSMASNDEDYELNIDETAYEKAKQILEKYPEESSGESSDQSKDGTPKVEVGKQDIDENQNPEVREDQIDDTDEDDTVATQIPEEEAKEVMEFVDEATIEVLGDSSQQKQAPATRRFCANDGIDSKSKKYHENVSDDCLLPKMQTASQLFSIRYTFARCIFEQENPRRDRLAHNQNGNGLAQIVNVTAKEINKRWQRQDNLSLILKQCLQHTSNRHDQFLHPIDSLNVPASYSKKDIVAEAAHRPATTRLNPLYRDDSICMGLMTMGIKVQEAKGRKDKHNVSDSELARRYNGSKYQQRYARAVVACIDRYKKKGTMAEVAKK